jgi:hypothetical protein
MVFSWVKNLSASLIIPVQHSTFGSSPDQVVKQPLKLAPFLVDTWPPVSFETLRQPHGDYKSARDQITMKNTHIDISVQNVGEVISFGAVQRADGPLGRRRQCSSPCLGVHFEGGAQLVLAAPSR